MENNKKDYGIQDMFKDVYNAYKSALEEVKKDERFKDLLDFKGSAYLFNNGKIYKWDTENGETCSECRCDKCKDERKERSSCSIADKLKQGFNIKSKSDIEQEIETKIKEVIDRILKDLKPASEGGRVILIQDDSYKGGKIVFGLPVDDTDFVEDIVWICNGGSYITDMSKKVHFEYSDKYMYTNVPLTNEIEKLTGFDKVGFIEEQSTFIFISKSQN